MMLFVSTNQTSSEKNSERMYKIIENFFKLKANERFFHFLIFFEIKYETYLLHIDENSDD